jgi:SAM-dependent methyltransferase
MVWRPANFCGVGGCFSSLYPTGFSVPNGKPAVGVFLSPSAANAIKMQTTSTQHALSPVSPWIERWSHLLPKQARVLDVACGSGRHLQWFLNRGHAVTGIDIDVGAARMAAPNATLVCSDMENAPWPLMKTGQPEQFGAVIVTNYLWRPLFPTVIQSLAPGGILMWETFASGNETVGRPTRPDFLLHPGELLAACEGLHIIAYENGTQANPSRFVQRIVAIRPDTAAPPAGWNALHLL